MTDPRISLGRVVRDAWVTWAREQPDPKPSWLLRWDEIDGGQREVDMRIGEAVAAAERERLGVLPSGERDAVLADLGALLNALGLGDHARPESPHEVMLQCIAEAARLHNTLRRQEELAAQLRRVRDAASHVDRAISALDVQQPTDAAAASRRVTAIMPGVRPEQAFASVKALQAMGWKTPGEVDRAVKAEREHMAVLAEQHDAWYAVTVESEGIPGKPGSAGIHDEIHAFADLIRSQP